MSICVHGDNIHQKETHRTKYQDSKSKQYLGRYGDNTKRGKRQTLLLLALQKR